MSDITITTLTLADAHELAPLLAAYTQDQKRGAPGQPDEYYAELLIADPAAEILGARRDGRLIGFAVFYDLPDTMTGRRAGQLDDIFVIQDAREHGTGQVLVEAILEEGAQRRWTHMRWMVPTKPVTAGQLAAKMASTGPWKAFVIPVERTVSLYD